MTAPFQRPSRILSIASGKGGVGKTSVAVNLATALRHIGRRVLLVDCDLGMANAAMLMGLDAPVTIDDVLQGRLGVDEVVIDVDGVMLLPGANTGNHRALDAQSRLHLSAGLRPFSRMTDFILVDTPTGISPFAMETASAADAPIVVLCEDQSAFINAFTMVKMLSLDHGCKSFQIVANMVANEAAGRDLFGRFSDVLSRFLPAEATFLGSIPDDRMMRNAALRGQCCANAYPHSPAAMAFSRVAARLVDKKIKISGGGNRLLGQESLHVVR